MKNQLTLSARIVELEKRCKLFEASAEDSLKAERNLALLLENTQDFVFLKDNDHRFIMTSDAHAKIVGCDSWKSLVGQTDFDIFPNGLANKYHYHEARVLNLGIELTGVEEVYFDSAGQKKWVSTNKKPIFNDEGDIVGLLGISRDITRQKRQDESISFMASHDMLTGLKNRSSFLDAADREISIAGRNDLSFAVLFIDLNDFKKINDLMGHEAGDAVLVAVAKRMGGMLRESDLICRYGGDEFVLLLSSTGSAYDVGNIIDKLLSVIVQPIVIPDDRSVTVGCSIGAAFYPRDGQDIESLMRVADAEMYKNKNSTSA